jgi:hypothetical protein
MVVEEVVLLQMEQMLLGHRHKEVVRVVQEFYRH